MHIKQTIRPALQTVAMIGAALFASQIALAQTTAEPAQETIKVSSCIPAGEMLERFLARDIDDLPHYNESVGKRLQRQHPTTHMYLHAKYNEGNGRSFAHCQYSNNAGLVASYGILDAYADATDGTCGPRYCVQGAYWRKEWSESSQEKDKPGLEYIYTCMRNLEDGRAVPSGACGFSLPEN